MLAGEAQQRRHSLRAAAACAAPAVLVTLTVLLPFLGKAFTIDDVTFLLQAKHVLDDPLHPTAFQMVFHGVPTRLSHDMVTGPVMAYLLVPALLLGGAEWAAHAIQVTLLVMAAMATASLALRLSLDRAQATLASILVVTSPAVLGMAATAMPDVPAMAFAVAGMERLVAWRQNGRAVSALASALLLALAILSRPHVLLVAACAGLWLVAQQPWRGEPWRRVAALTAQSLIPVALAVALTAAAVYVTRDPASGNTTASATLGRVQLRNVTFNLASFALQWTVAFPLVIAWLLLRGRRFLGRLRTGIAFNLGLVLAWSGGILGRDEWWRWLPVTLLIGVSTAVLTDIIGDACERRDTTQLVLGFWLLIAVPAATYVQLPPKLLVPSAPAMALIIARQYRLVDGGRPQLRYLGAVAALSLILGTLVITADTALAQIGREGGRVVAELVRNGRRVWMDGAWGFQWYAMAAGARPMAEVPPFPQPGDVAVAGPGARLLRQGYPDKRLLFREVFADPGGRVHGDGAGFFTNWAGPWPWVWGRGEVGRIEVWRIDSTMTATR
jgi:hypothetical protein